MIVHRVTCIIRFTALVLLANQVFAQDYYTYRLNCRGLNDEQMVYLSYFSSEGITPLDSGKVSASSMIEFRIPADLPTGVLRTFLGIDPNSQLGSMRISKTLDLIYSGHNLDIKTSFSLPYDSLQVLLTEDSENRNYFSYLSAFSEYNNRMNIAYNVLRTSESGSSSFGSAVQVVDSLQMAWHSYEEGLIKSDPEMFSSRLIAAKAFPFVSGRLSIEERNEVVQSNFFPDEFFNDPSILRSSVVEDRVIQYMQTYFKPGLTELEQDEEFIKGIDIVLNKAKQGHPEVYQYVLNNLVLGFEMNKRFGVLDHLSNQYGELSCDNHLLSDASAKRLASASRNSIGKQAPEILTEDVNGKQFRLSNIVSEHTLVVFWASWCGHCQEVIPKLSERFQQINSQTSGVKQIEVVSVSLDSSHVELSAFLQHVDTTGWHSTICDYQGWNGKIARDYNVYATPSLFLLDRNKRIISKPSSIEQLNTYFEL